MNTRLEQLRKHIHDLEEALEDELSNKRRELRYRLDRSRVVFESEVVGRHRAARENLFSFLSRTRFLVVLTSPAIYALIIPLVLLDVFVGLYQSVCFPVYGIPKAKRSHYIFIDRQNLAYLNALQKLNCMYCGYANGLIAWVREVASRTEAYWCPIKHARNVLEPHVRYHEFSDFGDETAFPEILRSLRISLEQQARSGEGEGPREK